MSVFRIPAVLDLVDPFYLLVAITPSCFIFSDIVSQSPPAPSNDSWMGYLSNVVSASANYLPSQVTDTLMQGRAFATVHHNNYGKKNICALSM